MYRVIKLLLVHKFDNLYIYIIFIYFCIILDLRRYINFDMYFFYLYNFDIFMYSYHIYIIFHIVSYFLLCFNYSSHVVFMFYSYRIIVSCLVLSNLLLSFRLTEINVI